MNVSAVGAVRDVQQKGRDGITRIDAGLRWIRGLLERKAGTGTVVQRLECAAVDLRAKAQCVGAGNLRNVGLPLMNVGFVRIERPADGGDNGAVSRNPHAGQHGEIADEITREVGVVAETLNAAGSQVGVDIGAVRLLMGAAELSLQHQGRAEGVYPTRAVVLAWIIGDAERLPRYATRSRRVVIQGAVSEPEGILVSECLIDARGELVLVLPERSVVDGIVVGDTGIE